MEKNIWLYLFLTFELNEYSVGFHFIFCVPFHRGKNIQERTFSCPPISCLLFFLCILSLFLINPWSICMREIIILMNTHVEICAVQVQTESYGKISLAKPPESWWVSLIYSYLNLSMGTKTTTEKQQLFNLKGAGNSKKN